MTLRFLILLSFIATGTCINSPATEHSPPQPAAHSKEKLQCRWKLMTGGPVVSSPVVTGDTVYFGSWDQHFYAVDADTGKLRWRIRLSDQPDYYEVGASPIISDDCIYCPAYDGKLYALSCGAARRQWDFKTHGSTTFASPCIAGKLVICAGSRGTVHALDRKTGLQEWQFRMEGKGAPSPVYENGKVFVADKAGFAYCLSAEDGSLQWKYSTEDLIIASPVIQEGCVVIASADKHVHILSKDRGELVWKVGFADEILSTPCVSGDRIVVCIMNGNVFTLDPKAKTKRFIHLFDGPVFSSPAIRGRQVVAGSDSGELKIIDIESGKVCWSFRAGRGFLSSPCIRDAWVYIGCDDGGLYAFGPQRDEPCRIIHTGTTGKKWSLLKEKRKHPGVFINKNGIKALKNRIKTDPTVRNAWRHIRHRIREVSKMNPLAKLKKAHSRELRNLRWQIRHALHLAMAWQLGERKHHGEKARDILMEFALKYKQVPFYWFYAKERKYLRYLHPQASRLKAQTLDESHALLEAAWAYDLLWEFLTEKERKLIVEGLLLPMAHVVAKNNGGLGNWQAHHNIALAASALATGIPVGNDPVDGPFGLRTHMRQSVGADGVWFENTWGYHFFALEGILRLALICRENGVHVLNEKSMKKMLDAPLTNVMPTGFLPPFNDTSTDTGIFGPVYRLGYALFRDPQYPKYLEQDEPQIWDLVYGENVRDVSAKALPLKSQCMKESGVGILRAGENYAALDFGPHGSYHGHYDKLSFILARPEGTLGVDPGKIAYTSPLLPWYRTTLSHNTVVVDGRQQNSCTGQLACFEAGERFSGIHAECLDAYPGVRHARFLGLTAENLIVVDLLESSEEHTYDWLYHGNGELVTSAVLKKTEQDLGYGKMAKFISDRKLIQESEASLRIGFRIPKVNTDLCLLPDTERTVYTAVGPGPARGPKLPMVIQRKKGKNAVFAAVFDIHHAQPNVAAWTFQKEDEYWKISVTLKNGTIDRIRLRMAPKKGQIEFERTNP